MSNLYHWITDVAMTKWPGFTLSGDRVAPTFMHMPVDVFVRICERLSVRDVLCLRMANKKIAVVTQESIIWNSFLRRLKVPLPILPATSKYRFGEINPRTYERLMVRALYLEQNWRSPGPFAASSRFEAFDRTMGMKMLPGGKYLVTTSKNLETKVYSLLVWDLDHEGRRVALTASSSNTPFFKVEAAYGVVNNQMCIVIACAKPSMPPEGGGGIVSTVVVFSVPIYMLEKLVGLSPDSEEFRSFTNAEGPPFSILHQSVADLEVNQLALGEFNSEMVLLVVHRPHALVFHYLESGGQGDLLLDIVGLYPTLRHCIWGVKLLTSQNSVLVSRVLSKEVVKEDSTLFTLDIFLLPAAGWSRTHPTPLSTQILSGLCFDGFSFSDLDTSWFASMRDPGGLLPAPINMEPPPISIFITTRKPRGFVQCIMRPEPVPNEYVELPYKRGRIRRFMYDLPAIYVQRNVWSDDCARPMVIPGAYRSIISMRPHVSPRMQMEPLEGIEMQRWCTYATRMEGYDSFSTPGSTGNLCTVTTGEEAMEVDEEVQSTAAQSGETGTQPKRERTLRIPAIPNDLAWDMTYGTMAMVFEESTGRMCVATNQDTSIHVLDFGGQNWELAVVKA